MKLITGVYPNTLPLDAVFKSDEMGRFAPLPTFMSRPFGEDDRWLSLNSTYPSAMQQRFKLLAKKPDWVIDRLPGAEVKAAELELRDAVTSYLTRTYPEVFRQQGRTVSSSASGVSVNLAEADPMIACAALASEDFLLLMPSEKSQDGKDIYRVKSGALLFPNAWSLSSKFSQPEPRTSYVHKHAEWERARTESLNDARLGKSMDEIHKGGPVLHYMNHYAPRVEHFFNAMKPGAFYWRRNWSPHHNGEPFAHADAPPVYANLTPAFWRDKGYLRVEQQTLNKLPQSGAIVFGIKTYHWKLSDVFNHPTAFEALVTANAQLSPEMVKYRDHSLLSFRPALAQHERKLGRKPTKPLNPVITA